MRIYYILILSVIVLTNCVENKTLATDSVALENRKSESKKSVSTTLLSQYNDNHSITLKKLLKKISQDNYKIDSITKLKTRFIAFDRNDGLSDTVEIIELKNIQNKIYKAKRNTPTKPGGKTYPRFTISEFSFDNNSLAKRYKNRIDSIINCTDRIDLRNEKNYDYTFRIENNLIYISCNSMYLSQFSNKYKSVLKEFVLINDSSYFE